MSKTVAYIRTSTDKQDIKNQRHEILEYGNREGMRIDEFIEVTISSGQSSRKRRIEELQERLNQAANAMAEKIVEIGNTSKVAVAKAEANGQEPKVA